MSVRRRLGLIGLILLPLLLALGAVGAVLFARQGGFAPYNVPNGGASDVPHDAATLQRGEYLARLGNCATCHTARGGKPFAGARGFVTGYGWIYSTNLTPDVASGIGDWSLPEFAHVLRNGVSRHGVLYPVFPYAHFAALTDDDIAAIYAYLRSLPPVATSQPQNLLEWPASWRPALIGWRMLYYRPDTSAAASSDRGRYLADGIGHCAMCHSRRGEYGSLPAEGYFAGGPIPWLRWYAPPLDSAQLARYSEAQLAQYLRAGQTDAGAAYGPMAEVIYGGLHVLTDADATAMARWLKSVPAHAPAATQPLPAMTEAVDGAAVYRRVCADCHADDGGGQSGRYPALRDAVAMTAPDAINAVRLVLYGGLPPTTAANPQPYSMPPFVYRLSAAEIAAVVNYTRREFGRRSSALTAADVEADEGIVLE